MSLLTSLETSNDLASRDVKRALRLEYLFVGYNSLEAVLAISFGLLAGSIALVGFGLDSVVESLSALILIWHLKSFGSTPKEEEEKMEERAERFVALTFFVLGGYVLLESVLKLVNVEKPEPSTPGIFLAMASLVIMPVLGRKKYELGKAIESRALVADSKETFVCALLSLALLLGLSIHKFTGFWQADPLIGILVSLFLFKEGYEIFEDEDEDE